MVYIWKKYVAVMSAVCFLIWMTLGTPLEQSLIGTILIYIACTAMANIREL